MLGSCWNAMVGRGSISWGKELAAVWSNPQSHSGNEKSPGRMVLRPREGRAAAVCWSKGRWLPLGQLLPWHVQGKGEAGATLEQAGDRQAVGSEGLVLLVAVVKLLQPCRSPLP